MRLVSAKLVNVCQHKELSVEFGAGITGVFGRNGVGKSNLFSMIAASLTNDFSVVPGTKEQNVRWGMPSDERSYVSTVWSHDNRKFSLTRGLSPSKNSLKVAGGKEITKTAEINNVLGSLLSCNKQLIDEFMFVRQGELFSFISARPAARAVLLAQLCQVEKAEKLWNLLGEQIKLDSVMIQLPTRDRDELERRLREVETEEVAILSKLRTAKKNLLDDAERDHVSASLRKYATKGELKRTLREKSDRANKLRNRQEQLEKALDEHRQKHRSAKQFIEDNKEEAGVYKNTISKLEESAKKLARKKWLLRQLEQPLPVKPRTPTGYEPSEKLQEEISRLKAEQSLIEKRNAALEGRDECPTCGSVVSPEQKAKINGGGSELKKIANQLAQLIEQSRTSRGYEKALNTFHSEDAVARLHVRSWRSELDRLGDVAEQHSATKLANMEAFLSRFDQMRDNLSGYLARANDAADRLKETTEELQEQRASLTVTRKKLADLKTLPDREGLRERWTKHKQAKSTRLTLRGRLTAIREEHTRLSSWLAEIDEFEKRSKAAKEWIEDLESYRGYVHRDALPKLVVQRKLERVISKANKLLEDLDAPFNVTADSDLAFVAIKRNGQREAADRLSGAEKAILAIAFRFAVNAVFASELGMMVLDEPTAGLDEHNMDVLADVLGRLANVTKRRDQQLIIITHDRRLERSFDHVLTL